VMRGLIWVARVVFSSGAENSVDTRGVHADRPTARMTVVTPQIAGFRAGSWRAFLLLWRVRVGCRDKSLVGMVLSARLYLHCKDKSDGSSERALLTIMYQQFQSSFILASNSHAHSTFSSHILPLHRKTVDNFLVFWFHVYY